MYIAPVSGSADSTNEVIRVTPIRSSTSNSGEIFESHHGPAENQDIAAKVNLVFVKVGGFGEFSSISNMLNSEWNKVYNPDKTQSENDGSAVV